MIIGSYDHMMLYCIEAIRLWCYTAIFHCCDIAMMLYYIDAITLYSNAHGASRYLG